MMDELLDPTVAAGEMNSSHLENAKRAISLLVDMGQTTKQDVDKAWNLLDRLVEELKHPSNVALLPKEQTSLLNGILTVWRQSVATRFYIRVEKRYAIEESKHVLSKLDGDGPFFQPNTVSYNEVMHALNRFAKYTAGTKRTRGAIRLRVSHLTETIVKRMNKKAEKNHFVKPDMRTFTSLIFTYMSVRGARIPDAYERAEAILNHMKREGLKTGTRSHHAVFGVLVKTMQNAAEKAEEFLYRTQEEYDSGNEDVKPDATSFAHVIEAWAIQKDQTSAQRAEEI
jgi:hypothetical protein